MRDALINLTQRVPLVDVKFFVTAVMLQRETGGNLAEILDNLSYVIRERFKIMRQVRVHTAQGRLTMVLLMALPPVIVMVMLIMSPNFIRPLIHGPTGPYFGGRWYCAADDRLFLDSQSNPDTGLVLCRHLGSRLSSFVTIAVAVIFPCRCGIRALFGVRNAVAGPGLAGGTGARETADSRTH